MIPTRPPRGLCRIVSLVILLTASGARQASAVAVPCATAAECDDGNPCTGDLCDPQGVCQHEVQPLCVPCAVDADCEDQDPCTTDSCDRGVCAHASIADCPAPPEACAGGIDEDGDGLVDCHDPDCATAPECQPREICDNCVDDDGDGLVDSDDPDCCDARRPLAVSHMSLSPSAPTHGDRLDLQARFASSAPPLFDPTAQDTSLQISDPRGEVFCATVPAAHWVRPRRGLYRFADEAGTFAGGLETGKFAVRRDGDVVFRTHGRRIDLGATTGATLRITVRVGDQCAQDTMTLRTKRSALVFP